MSASDSFPLGSPAFVSHALDRAAHLRGKDEKLMALESDSRTRAYVVSRDSLVVKREGEAPPPPGTIFLGLRDGAAVFGMGISAPSAEKLIGRDDVAVNELRGMAMQGAIAPE